METTTQVTTAVTTEPTLAEAYAENLRTRKANRPQVLLKKVQLALYGKSITMSRLKDLSNACAEIVTKAPLYSEKTKENRKWNPRRRYAFGPDIAEVSAICSGIQYSAEQHRVMMLAETGVDEALVVMFNQAIGTLPYYDEKTRSVIEGQKVDLETLTALLYVLEDSLECEIDKSLLTQANIDKEYKSHMLTAMTTKANAEYTERLAAESLVIE